jgi:hypothetical protein
MTAIVAPFHVETEPFTTTGVRLLVTVRLRRAAAAVGDDRTAPPRYSGLMAAARSAGIPVAVKGETFGLAAVVVAWVAVGAAAFLTALGAGEEHPLSAMEPARRAETPTKSALRDVEGGTQDI